MTPRATLRDYLLVVSFFGILAFALVGFVLISLFPCMIRSNQPCVMRALAPRTADYASMASLPEALGEGYIAGRLVVVNAGEPVRGSDGELLLEPGTLNREIHFEQSDRALDPDEVGTVVLLRWGKRRVKTYPREIDSYAVTCEVLVVDARRRLVVARKRIEGSEVRDHDAYASAYTQEGLKARLEQLQIWGLLGEIPAAEISLYIESLRRR
jgi:hypothetical protein